MPDSKQEQLIALLADGKFHSGEKLGGILGISRAAIAKRMKKLTDIWGLQYHSVNGRGYRLQKPLELLDRHWILQELNLAAEGFELHTKGELVSTNDFLMQMPRKTSHYLSACLAEYQTNGRGRRGRQWISPFGQNIYLSVANSIDVSMSGLSGLSLAIGVLLAECLANNGVNGLTLKWPNDLLLNGKKLGGILVEVNGEPDGPVFVVIGVGLNVSHDNVQQQVTENQVTSLAASTIKTTGRNYWAVQLLKQLSSLLLSFSTSKIHSILSRWDKYDAYYNQRVILKSVHQEISGICKGINHEGAILLEREGVISAFHGGEISLRVDNELTH